jgi:hypothetical protein
MLQILKITSVGIVISIVKNCVIPIIQYVAERSVSCKTIVILFKFLNRGTES